MTFEVCQGEPILLSGLPFHPLQLLWRLAGPNAELVVAENGATQRRCQRLRESELRSARSEAVSISAVAQVQGCVCASRVFGRARTVEGHLGGILPLHTLVSDETWPHHLPYQ